MLVCMHKEHYDINLDISMPHFLIVINKANVVMNGYMDLEYMDQIP